MSDQTNHSFFRRLIFALKFLEIRLRFIFILIITALVVGYWDYIQNYIERWQRNRAGAPTATVDEHDHSGLEYYCPMHTFVVRSQPGNCPICGMDLSRREKGQTATSLPAGTLARVQVSPERILQAGVKTVPVSRQMLTHEIRSYGIIETDETKVSQIVARFPGRVEELFVNAVGMEVGQGDPLARIYSPRYLAAAQEYIQALNSEQRLRESSVAGQEARRRAAQLSEYARQRLALAGFTEDQLNEIARTGNAEERVTLYAPLSGTVLEKNVLLGDQVEEGTSLYRVADLSTLWVQALIPEGDIALVKLGMSVEVTTVSRPGEIFYGEVDFIYPTVNAETRSARVRIVVENEGGVLKPGMYATIIIQTPAGEIISLDGATTRPDSKPIAASAPTIKLPTTSAEDARAFLSGLAGGDGYFDCPMHPEVVSDKKDDCPKCGMFLVPKQKQAAQVGDSMTAADDAEWIEGWACPMHIPQLVNHPGICPIDACGMQMRHWKVQQVPSIPEAAVIDTGTRYIVYVETAPGIYDAREVRLGKRAGDFYPVLAGLDIGEIVVAHGSFLIDAEARLNPTTASAHAHATAPPANQ